MLTSGHASAGAGLPYLTPGQPGIGGVIKRFDDDFIVEELPLYRPCGDGTHVFFTIEKRGMPTLRAVRLIARQLGKRPQDIGYAGLKDAHGVTRQVLSVEHAEPRRIERLSLDGIKVVSVNRHGNKLKLGHLAGNRFSIKIRGCLKGPLPNARAVLDVLKARGVPNYFGPQRFGARGDNAAVGLAVVRGDYDEALALILGRAGPVDHGDVRRARDLYDKGDLAGAAASWARSSPENARVCRVLMESEHDARRGWRAIDHTMRRFYVSSLQSELFNQTLARRIDSIDRLAAGDIAWKHRNGASFRVDDAAAEQARCDAFEISPTGPLFGRRMMQASGVAGKLEAAVLAEVNLTNIDIRWRDAGRLLGGRRPLRVPLSHVGTSAGEDKHDAYLLLEFDLPPGAYATCVTRELCKSCGESHREG
ncbi:MAG: tRNA pseudouridine(13) synthase TruD [Phycisphaerae bacterium]